MASNARVDTRLVKLLVNDGSCPEGGITTEFQDWFNVRLSMLLYQPCISNRGSHLLDQLELKV